MHIVHVHVRVKSDCVDQFKRACVENAGHSVLEPGIARFDVLQQQDDPTRFELIEAYGTPDDVAKHKETAHYAKWAEAVAPLMAEDRTKDLYTNVFPDEHGWR